MSIPRPVTKCSALPSRTLGGRRSPAPAECAAWPGTTRAACWEPPARVVGAAGFEPASPRGPRVLSPLRLPVSSRPRHALRLSFTMIPPAMQCARGEVCLASRDAGSRAPSGERAWQGRRGRSKQGGRWSRWRSRRQAGLAHWPAPHLRRSRAGGNRWGGGGERIRTAE